MTIQALPGTPWRLVSAAARWHVSTQQTARRNALVASTALAQRRHERDEVEEFLAAHAAARTGTTDRVPVQHTRTA